MVTNEMMVEGAVFWCTQPSIESGCYDSRWRPAVPWRGKLWREGLGWRLSHFDAATGRIDDDSNATAVVEAVHLYAGEAAARDAYAGECEAYAASLDHEAARMRARAAAVRSGVPLDDIKYSSRYD